MIPYFSIEFFHIGDFHFYSWGFFFALAFFVGLILCLMAGRRSGIASNKIIILVILVYLAALAGARLSFILQTPVEFLSDPAEIFDFNDGMMLYGGLAGGLIVGWLYIRRLTGCRLFLQAIIPAIPLSMAIGRVGCFLLNDHVGAITNVPWAILWPDGNFRHSVALYLILFDLALAGFLWRRGRRLFLIRPSRSEERVGETVVNFQPPASVLPPSEERRRSANLILFFIFYPLGRFFLDFTRDVSADPRYGWFAVSQWISLVLLSISILYYVMVYIKKRHVSA